MATIGIFRKLIRSKNYVVSHHAADELEDDDLTILDLESIILTGNLSNGNMTEKQMKRNMSSTEEPSQTMKQKPSSRSVSAVNSSSSPSTSSEKCAYCGSSNLHHRLVTRSFGRGDRLLVIEGIPSISCGNCGESYFTAATMHEIERVKAHRKALAVTRPVPVAAFA